MRHLHLLGILVSEEELKTTDNDSIFDLDVSDTPNLHIDIIVDHRLLALDHGVDVESRQLVSQEFIFNACQNRVGHTYSLVVHRFTDRDSVAVD